MGDAGFAGAHFEIKSKREYDFNKHLVGLIVLPYFAKLKRMVG